MQEDTRPSFADYLFAIPQYLLPHHAISRLTLWVTRIRIVWLKNGLMKWFIGRFNVNMQEAEVSDYHQYENFNSFFTRALKKEMRPVASAETNIICPVDGAVSQVGKIQADTIYQAKGHDYSAMALLGGDRELAEIFHNGAFVTLYLSPRDYHRIHMPVDAQLRSMLHVPGRLFSVNTRTVRCIPGLFARNERVVAVFDSSAGPMAMVLVGAINVGCIETTWHGVVTPPHRQPVNRWNYTQHDAIKFRMADEMGRFNMGSTVICLFANNNIEFDNAIVSAAPVRMGQLLATF